MEKLSQVRNNSFGNKKKEINQREIYQNVKVNHNQSSRWWCKVLGRRWCNWHGWCDEERIYTQQGEQGNEDQVNIIRAEHMRTKTPSYRTGNAQEKAITNIKQEVVIMKTKTRKHTGENFILFRQFVVFRQGGERVSVFLDRHLVSGKLSNPAFFPCILKVYLWMVITFDPCITYLC